MQRIRLTTNDLETICALVRDHDITPGFELVQHSDKNGIGHCTDITWRAKMHGREITLTAAVVDHTNW